MTATEQTTQQTMDRTSTMRASVELSERGGSVSIDGTFHALRANNVDDARMEALELLRRFAGDVGGPVTVRSTEPSGCSTSSSTLTAPPTCPHAKIPHRRSPLPQRLRHPPVSPPSTRRHPPRRPHPRRPPPLRHLLPCRRPSRSPRRRRRWSRSQHQHVLPPAPHLVPMSVSPPCLLRCTSLGAGRSRPSCAVSLCWRRSRPKDPPTTGCGEYSTQWA